MESVRRKLGEELREKDIMINTISNSFKNNQVYYTIEDIIFDTQFALYHLVELYLWRQ